MATFATWVEPLAALYRENRADVVKVARSVSDDQLSRAAADDGWSVRQEIVHIAASDPDFIGMLGGLLDGGPLDMSVFADIDDRNKRNLEAWKERSIADVVAELESNGRAIQVLLARLTEEDSTRQPEGMPFPLSHLIQGYGQHGLYHLGQVQSAIGQGG